MKKAEFLSEARRMSLDELLDRAKQLAEEHMKLRFRKASTGQLDQPHVVKEVKRNLARINTLITAARAKEAVAAKEVTAPDTEAKA